MIENIYVYSGIGYSLEELELSQLDRDIKEITIDELAFICVLQNKGDVRFLEDIEDLEEYYNDERFIHCDLSDVTIYFKNDIVKEFKDLNVNSNQCFINIENLYAGDWYIYS